MNKIQAVIFDLDGTLADTIPMIIAAYRKAVEPLVHRSLSDEEIVATFGPNEEGSVKALAGESYRKGTDDFIQHYESMQDWCTAPFEGIIPLLTSLQKKGIRLALITGKGKYTTDLTLKWLHLTPFFEQIETGSPEGSRKVEAISQVLHAFRDVPSAAVIYVGDSPSDITESRKAGIRPVAVTWSSTAEKEKLQAEEPEEIFETVQAFTDWLEQHSV